MNDSHKLKFENKVLNAHSSQKTFNMGIFLLNIMIFRVERQNGLEVDSLLF